MASWPSLRLYEPWKGCASMSLSRASVRSLNDGLASRPGSAGQGPKARFDHAISQKAVYLWGIRQSALSLGKRDDTWLRVLDTGLPPHDWLGNGTAKIDNRHAIMIYFGIYGQNQHAPGIVGDYQCVEQVEIQVCWFR